MSASNSKGQRALIIGNGSYMDLPSLSYSINDAQEFGAKLQTMHFEVTIGIDLTYDQMEEAIQEFVLSIGEKDTIVFFFIGHGVQWRNQNYLLPTNDDELTSECMLSHHAVSAKRLLQQITNRSPATILFLLDCSHDRDLSESVFTSIGLCQMTAPIGSFIAFACNIDELVEDISTNGRNGIFTEHLLQYVNESNWTIEEIMTHVRDDVARKTNNIQTPFLSNSLQSGSNYLGGFRRKTPLRPIDVDPTAMFKQIAITVAGGNGFGSDIRQLSNPWCLYVDDDRSILIADQLNHRIVEWRFGTSSDIRIIAGGNGQGDGPHQLNCPTGVIVDKENDSLIICDRDNQRVVRWPRRYGVTGETIISNVDCVCLTMDNDGNIYLSDDNTHEIRKYKIGESEGIRLAGGNGCGTRLDQLNQPRYMYVDQDGSLYVSDHANHRVVKWMKGETQGIVIAGGHGKGNSLTQLYFPNGIVVDQTGAAYIVDGGNHRVVRWSKEATQGTLVVGGNGRGDKMNQLNWPFGLSFDRQGNLYIVDMYNHRVQLFKLDILS